MTGNDMNVLECRLYLVWTWKRKTCTRKVKMFLTIKPSVALISSDIFQLKVCRRGQRSCDSNSYYSFTGLALRQSYTTKAIDWVIDVEIS